MDPFQNKAYVNIQSIQKAKFLHKTWHKSTTENPEMRSFFMFLFSLSLAGGSEELLLLFLKFWLVNTEF